MHDHATDGGIADYHDRASARDIRLHLDNAHDEMTSGWTHEQLVERHWALHIAEADRLAEIEAAANVIAQQLAGAPPAVVESVLGDRSLYLTDANGTLYLAEPVGIWTVPGHARAFYEDDIVPEGAEPLYRLSVEGPPPADLIGAMEASIAATRAYLDAQKRSEGAHLSDSPAGVASLAGPPPAGAPSPVVDLMAALEASLAAAKADRNPS